MNLSKIKQQKSISELLEFGIINLDKPSGPTSFTVSDFVRKKLGLRKTSHFGTLDPKVTGVLPIALNRACKLTGFFLSHDKTYVGIMRLHDDISIKKLQETINKKFLGEITQLPPVKSRVKRAERQRTIHYFKILEVENTDDKKQQEDLQTNDFGNSNKKRAGPRSLDRVYSGNSANLQEKEKKGKDFLFETKVEGGTYIRKLIHDLGEELGIGAHMLELRRTQAGIFNEKTAITLYELEKAVEENTLDKYVIPAEKALQEIFPKIEVKEKETPRLFTGKPIYYEDLIKDSKFCCEVNNSGNSNKKRAGPRSLDRVHSGNSEQQILKYEKISVFSKDKFVGVYKITNEKEIFARPEFVLQPIN